MKIQSVRLSTRCIALLWIFSLALAGCAGSGATPTVMPVATLAPPATPTAIPPTALLPAATPAPDTYWPTDDWRTSIPEEQGMDGARLAQMLEAVQQQHLNLHSLLVIRHGYIVSETYYAPYAQDTRHELYSCTKSFISTLVGIAVDQGKIRGLDERVIDYFPDRAFANLDAQKETMTVDDLLTMRSGLDWEEGDPAYVEMYQSRDWVKYVLDKPMAQSPGSHFNYCSGCSHVLSAIVRQAAGMETRAYADQFLFEPLGIKNAGWDIDSTGMVIGGWGLHITPRQMAKLGYLYLHGGMWDGQQIVSAEWVKAATQRHTDTDGSSDYGYQWWLYPDRGAYAALGRFGQTIFVVPESDLIIVFTAQIDSHGLEFDLIDNYILPAVQRP
jgi:CubicO group peptidase (beta-lactamase class C family)